MKWQGIVVKLLVRHVAPMLLAAVIGALAAAGLVPPEVEQCVRIQLGVEEGDPV